MDDLVEQLLLVPEAPHDDLVDALELAVDAATTNRWIGPLPDLSKITFDVPDRHSTRDETALRRPLSWPAWLWR